MLGVWNRTEARHRIGMVLTFPGCATLTPKLKWIRFGFGSRSQQEEISSCSFRNCIVLLQNYFFNETLFLNFKKSFPLRLFVFFAQILFLKSPKLDRCFEKGRIFRDNSNKTDPRGKDETRNPWTVNLIDPNWSEFYNFFSRFSDPRFENYWLVLLAWFLGWIIALKMERIVHKRSPTKFLFYRMRIFMVTKIDITGSEMI